ncbi:DNA replication protein DnaD [Bacillus thuringiensis serovar brasilensis]|uniref:DnaD domain-containing protein n=1 Tax=Bacillus cereus group TaxID=86661 RepID=UPI000A3CD5AD|nr:DnaD domain protein [Bacillus thuringiensis]MCU5027627.1 DnaD domain protein [Bacillus cereus]MRA74704.1 DnaD domain protein [Bacillus thuringiensis]MRA93271.1 DnaD domain protein [Bacillus thuringiensis]MRC55885.1 DnaD domain protein [Bacillus thuringiensis]OTX37170.1 DNA replication protein DnaD [Bacillus thuringiensis serovar brasilensis]
MSNIVTEIGGLNFKGNVVDHEWFNYITFSNGKPHIVAIMVLSEIVYWYRPTVIRDEIDGKVTYKKKFKADKLQKNYQQLADTFGFTKLQVKRACDLLTDMLLIKIEFRTINADGKILNNVMFVEPVPTEIKKISSMYQQIEEGPGYLEVNRVVSSKSRPSSLTSKESPNFKVKTNTEITTKITTENVSSSIFSFYENNFGILNIFIAESISQWVNDTSEELVQAAMERALKQQKKWNYAEGILKQWVNNNVKTLKDVDALETEYQRNKGVKKRVGINRKSDNSDSEYIGL